MRNGYLLFGVFIMMATFANAEKEYGTYFERDCSQGQCTQILYNQPTFYQNQQGVWQPFATEFSINGCNAGASACVLNNLYRMHVRDFTNQNNLVTYENDDITLQFSPLQLSYRSNTINRTLSLVGAGTRIVQGRNILFNNTYMAGTGIEFEYTPYAMKESITIARNNTLPRALLTGNGTIIYESSYTLVGGRLVQENDGIYVLNSSNSVSAFMPRPFMQDGRGQKIYLDTAINTSSWSIEIPVDWLLDVNRSYPVTIDPTITLNNASILFDGSVTLCQICVAGTEMTRDGTSTEFFVGTEDDFGEGTITVIRRGDIDWDISSIPDTAIIIDINLTMNTTVLATTDKTLYFRNMTGNSSFWADNNSDNALFYAAIRNGALLHQQSLSATGDTYYNFSNVTIINQLQNALAQDWWNFGIHTDETGTLDVNRFVSKENALAQYAPRLQIDYILPPSPPTYWNITEQPASNTTVALVGNNYVFNSTWLDDVSVSDVYIVFDSVNYTLTSGRVTILNNIYSFNETNLGIGVHNYTWFANDSDNNENQTETLSYRTLARESTWELAVIASIIMTLVGTYYAWRLL